jgi:hypothetical protein
MRRRLLSRCQDSLRRTIRYAVFLKYLIVISVIQISQEYLQHGTRNLHSCIIFKFPCLSITLLCSLPKKSSPRHHRSALAPAPVPLPPLLVRIPLSQLSYQNYRLSDPCSADAQAQAEIDLQMEMQMQQEFAAYSWGNNGFLWGSESILLRDDFDLKHYPLHQPQRRSNPSP